MANFKRVGKRLLFYILQGYHLATLPFVFLGYTTSIYYLAIENIPALHSLFPRFTDFIAVAGLTIPLFCGLVGYVYMKRSWLFKASMEVQTESNPYTTVKTTPVNIPSMKLFRRIAKEKGYDDIVAEYDKILARSET